MDQMDVIWRCSCDKWWSLKKKVEIITIFEWMEEAWLELLQEMFVPDFNKVASVTQMTFAVRIGLSCNVVVTEVDIYEENGDANKD